ncbi:MAG: hypothetical protein Crog4KO_29220 [Crocinitomicaceae bacterium]
MLIGGVLLFGLLLVWLFSSGGGQNGNGAKAKDFYSSDWRTKFQPFDKNPRGTYLFHTLLQTHIKSKDLYVANNQAELDSILNMTDKKRTFVYVGNLFGLEDAEIDSIMGKVAEGSDLFLSFNKSTENVLDRFFDEFYLRTDYAESELVFTPAGDFKMWNIFQKDTIARSWNAFGDITTKGDSKSLSSFMEMDNFIEIKIGKGKVFLQTNPNMYFNYQLKRTPGFKYSNYTIDQLSKYRDVVLLELGRLPDDFGNEDVDEQEGPAGKEDDSFLRWILERPNLRNALLLLIIGLILFVLFRSQRKRPVVPYRGKKKNMTLAFTETITSIYYSKQNPYGLLQVQRKNFYATILKHYFVDLNRREGDREIRTLSEKSNKPFDEIKALITQLETKEVSRVTDQTIMKVSKEQQAFYKDMGIITDRLEVRMKKREMVFRRSLLLPMGLIFLGIIAVLCGFYFLVVAVGVGIALWPIGVALITLGVLRLIHPYLKVTEKELILYNGLGGKSAFLREDIISTKSTSSGVVIQLHNNKQLVINYWELSYFDREQFDRFISKVHTLDL